MTRRAIYGSASLVAMVVANQIAVPHAQAQTVGAETSTPDRQAQDRLAQASSGAIEEIVVTARRREENAQNVPISIIALGSGQLERKQINQVTDLQRIAPGLTVDVVNNKPSTVQVGIRGQRMNAIFATQDPPTAIYFAEAMMAPLQGLNSAFYDLQSVQVLKGPQGTLFGRNTTGGAVVVTPARPVHQFEGYIRGKIGNRETYGIEAVLNAPLTGTLAVRGSVKYEEHGPYQHYIAPVPAGRDPWQERYVDARISTLWDPTDSFSNYSIAYYSRNKNGAIGANLVAINPLSPAAAFNGTGAKAAYPDIYDDLLPGSDRDPLNVASSTPQFDDTETWGIINTTTLDVGAVKFKNIAAYRNVTNESRMNIAGSRAPILLTYQDAHHKSFSEELQMSGSALDDRLDFIAGLYYYRQTGFDLQSAPAFYGPPLPQTVSTFLTYIRNQSTAAYLSADFKITDRLTASAGLRYSIDKRRANWRHQAVDLWSSIGVPFVPGCILRDSTGAVLPVSQCDISNSKTFKEPTWNLSLNYEFAQGSMIYLSQRRGYRSGGFNSRAVTAPQRQPFQPETVMDYEAGIKTDFELGDWAIRLNADVYRANYKGLQRTVTINIGGNNFTNSLVNAASAKVEGFELDLTVRPTPNLTLGATYAYTKPKYNQFSQFVGGILRDFSDRDLAGVPRNELAASIEYKVPMDPSLGELDLSLNYSYTDKTVMSDTYQSKQQLAYLYTPAQLALIPDDTVFQTPAYSLVNASIGWLNVRGAPLDLSFYMKNVFDKRYPINGSGLYESLGVNMITYGAPRTFGLIATYRFR
ncbi:iron complex outermembrane recepter protein [Novosphingobium sp. CF614]|uniref:TonB-dependent receptor n=1 Tax=Novosphingobium sp. CF614 TaxID=1884364 RepID=UPI0008E01FFD|nr:TonB-dependent receptor [Novosphingobium sp. CF614]SFG09916.1 iron complex outermembrane recepter protein [Novosphingobium sp. CF614]